MNVRPIVPELEAGMPSVVIGLARHAHGGRMKRILALGSLAGSLLLAAGCVQTTVLFTSDFNAGAIGQPPLPAQLAGTARVESKAGSVLVVAPLGGIAQNWVQIQSNSPRDAPSLQCNVSQSEGDGIYIFSTFLYIPSGSGLATIQFEPAFDFSDGFMHLDFTQDNRVRIDDDDSTTFGTFPRDQVFLVRVTLNIKAAPSAHIVLAFNGASGEANHNVLPAFIPPARQFGAVTLWMGFPWTGTFYATSVTVERQNGPSSTAELPASRIQ
jgi:hypothetical protein